MCVPLQNFATIHSFSHESGQWIANGQIESLDISGIYWTAYICTKELHDLCRVTKYDTLNNFDDSSIPSILADLSIFQAWIGNQCRIRFPPNSGIKRCFKKTIDIDQSFFKWVPIIRCEYRYRWIDCASSLHAVKQPNCILGTSFSFLMTYEQPGIGFECR